MKIIKGLFVTLIILAVAVFAAFIFLPVDSFVAKRAAEMNGYEIVESFSDTEYRYYYNTLSEDEQLAYRLICSCITDFPEEIIVPALSDKELEQVFAALSYDNPEYFFLGNKCTLTSIGNVYYFMPQYLMSKGEYDKRISEVNAKADEVLSAIDKNASDYEKELYIHDYLAENCTYSLTETDMAYTIYGLLIDGKAGCEGYSRTAQYLLKKMGIVNHLATGTAVDGLGNRAGHMWNVVVIDGQGYNMDITWDDYSLESGGDSAYSNEPSHAYFNISSSDLSKTHTADDENVWRECVSASYNYYERLGLKFDTYNNSVENKIQSEIVKVLSKGNLSIEILFTNVSAYDKALESLVEDENLYRMLREANELVPSSKRINSSKIQYTLDKNKLIIRFFFVKQ